MAAELVETSRLWGRDVARITPEWVEPLAAHLVKRTYSEPHWEKDAGAVMAYEKVTLYGVPIVASRKVAYGRVDPELSRDLFIRNALVEGDWRTHHEFWHANRALLEEVEDLENRARRRDIVVDDETLFAFYDARVPAQVVSGRHFDAWWKKARREHADLLTFSSEMLVRDDVAAVSERDYPDTWVQADLRLPLTYQFEPGTDADGVTVHVPLAVLNQVRPDGFDWQIPGLRHDLVTALIRSLPKPVRVNFVPAPDVAHVVLQRLTPYVKPLVDALAEELSRVAGFEVSRRDFAMDRVPAHLRLTFRVEDKRRRVVAEGKDLVALQQRLRPKVRETVAETARSIERAGLTAWPADGLPRTYEQRTSDGVVRGFPALVEEGPSVAVRVLGTEAEQASAMRAGVRRLLLLTVPSPLKAVVRALSNDVKLALGASPYPSVPELLDDCVAAAIDAHIADSGGPPWDEAGFATLTDKVTAGLVDAVTGIVTMVADILATAQAVDRRLRATTSLALLDSLTDIRAELARLVHRGFVSEVGADRLPDYARYVRALDRRLEALPDHPGRDRTLMWQVAQVEQEYARLLDSLPAARRQDGDVRQIRWMVEELRVSLFAQTLRTAYPVSEKRVRRAIDALQR
jgi:ATP-dependent helicase HrpA